MTRRGRAGSRRDPGVRIVLLGRQGAGKGTQCVRLARHYVVPHISTGDMLRAAVKEGTDFGRKAKAVMDARRAAARRRHVRHRRGAARASTTPQPGLHPRRLPAARWPRPRRSTTSPPSEPLDLVIDLEVPEEVVIERIAAPPGLRTTAARTTRSTAPPSTPWICDNCGGDVVQRDDDTEEAIKRRLDLYEEQTAPADPVLRRARPAEAVDGAGHARRGHATGSSRPSTTPRRA